jgi:hypothetical protein
LSQRCAVCDQLLLEDDIVCWQCGHPVAGENVSALRAEPVGEEAASRKVQLSPATVYTGLTVLVIAAALFVTAYLGRQPRAQLALSELPPGWVWVRGGTSRFTFFLPEAWEVIIARNEDQEAELTTLVRSTAALQNAFQPLGVLDGTLITTFYGHGPIPGEQAESGLVLVARSRVLNQLSTDEMLALAARGADELGLSLEAAREVENFDQSYVYLAVTMDTVAGSRRCQQRLYPGRTEMVLLTACAGPESRVQRHLDSILGSFQRLSR